MEENNEKIRLTRKEFMSVFQMARLLSKIPDQEQLKDIPGSDGLKIVDIAYGLWALFRAAGGHKRRFQSQQHEEN